MLFPKHLTLLSIFLIIASLCQFTYQTSTETEQENNGQCFSPDQECSGEASKEESNYSKGVYSLNY